MTEKEICNLMIQCGLRPIEKHEWNQGHLINSDSFIEGDYTCLMQFAKELIRKTFAECSRDCRG